jgi:hypothetical protein
MRRAVLAALLASAALCGNANAQGHAPFAPVNPKDTSPASALDDMPSKTISNGIVSAKVYLPGEFGFYRSTRFDHAGMITHVTYKGLDYGRYWFVKTSPDVQNFTYDADGLVAHPSDVAAGPVEEFAQVGFDDAGPGGRFLKIGVGILKRDQDKYDRFHTYPILNQGRRTTKAAKDSIRFTQDIAVDPSGYGYSYSKTVRLTPGKAQMVIEDRLKNTGRKAIETTVYNHNFLTLSPGEKAVEIAAPFALTPVAAQPKDVVQFDGPRLRYLRGLTGQEQVAGELTGFSASASDNDFHVTDTASGYGVRIRHDQPISHLFFWSVPSTMGLEPYVVISLKPGEEKRWTYLFDYYGPGDARP